MTLQYKNKPDICKMFKEINKTLTARFYLVEFTAVFRKPSASALFSRILYWWIKNDRKPFYKFKQPCDHKLYKNGDSWCEELGLTRDGFSGALDSIAVKLRQGQNNIKQIKENSLITYYTDKNRLTWYEVNEEKICEFFSLFLTKAKTENRFTSTKTENRFTSSKTENRFTFFTNKNIKTTNKDYTLFNKNKFLLKSLSDKSERAKSENSDFKKTKEKLNINKKKRERNPPIPPFDKHTSLCSKSSTFSLPFFKEEINEMEKRKSLNEIVSDLSKPKEIDFSVFEKKTLTPTRLNEFMNMVFSSLGHTDQIYTILDKKVLAALKKLISSLKQHESMTDRQIAEFIYTVITTWDTLRKHPRLSSNLSRARIYNHIPNFWEIYQLHRELIYALKNPVTIDKEKVIDFVSVDLETYKKQGYQL